jgi:maleamate amidohydrolase
MQYSFPTLIPSECVGDRALAPHQANLLDIDAQYADVVSLADMLAYLGEHSPTD